MSLSKQEIEKRVADSYEIPNRVLESAINPMVTIRTSTYNHGPYIRQCIEGVLMQKTDFPFEFIIGEDFSTDNTMEIVKEYAEKYPDVIRVITADYNVGSKANGTRCRRASRGEYMAICEGDDYWTDPQKLQKQVEHLRDKPEVVLVFHDVLSVDEDNNVLNKSKIQSLRKNPQAIRLATFKEVTQALIPTLSVMYRNINIQQGVRGKRVLNGDIYLFARLSRYGEMHNVGGTMGAHRRHTGGVWTSLSELNKKLKLLNTRKAIAWEIHADDSLSAACRLATTSWHGFEYAFENNKKESLKFLGGYFCSFLTMMRYCKASEFQMTELIKCFFEIAGYPRQRIRSKMKKAKTLRA